MPASRRRPCAAPRRLRRDRRRQRRSSGLYPAADVSGPRQRYEVARALQGAGQGTLILAGRPGLPVQLAAREAGLPLIDYFRRPELECLNAIPHGRGLP